MAVQVTVIHERKFKVGDFSSATYSMSVTVDLLDGDIPEVEADQLFQRAVATVNAAAVKIRGSEAKELVLLALSEEHTLENAPYDSV